MRLTAAYPSREALAIDVAQQLGKGGLLVRGEVPAGLQQFAAVELEVTSPDGRVTVPAQVLQVFAGIGVAVALDTAACAGIAALGRGEAAAAAPASTAAAPAAASAPSLPPVSASPPTATAPRSGNHAAEMLAKIQRALNGDRDARFAVLRDPNRSVHVHVLRNPGLMLDEIQAIARMTTVSVDLLSQLAQKREWGHRPEIAIALVRNPTVPVPVAVELIAYVGESDLKLLAKDNRTREPIQRAARRRLLR